MTTSLDLKRRYNRSEAWKNMAADLKEQFRSSWKLFDDQCKEHDGMPKMVESIVEPNTFINGCIFGENGGREEDFVSLIKTIENQIKDRRLGEYAVHYYEGIRTFMYETDGDWHYSELQYQNDYEDDFMGVKIEEHHRTEYPSPILNSIQHLKRIQQLEDEHGIQEAIKLSKEIDNWNNTGDTLFSNGKPLDDKVLMYSLTARRLAQAVLRQFKE